jgi:hypothetical protein
MDNPKRRRHTSTLAALFVLVPVIAFVLYSSMHVAEFECEVCIAFGGQELCRTVTGQTREEGVRTGTNNACALLSSGMTDSMRCERTVPTKAECREL